MKTTIYTVTVTDSYTPWEVDGPIVPDGPAVEYPDGSKNYWTDGKFHRIDGPAVEWSNSSKKYYIDGKCLSKEEFENLFVPACGTV